MSRFRDFSELPSRVDIQVYKHAETTDAVLVSLEPEDAPVWLPRSEIEIFPSGGLLLEIEAPERLLEDTGLI